MPLDGTRAQHPLQSTVEITGPCRSGLVDPDMRILSRLAIELSSSLSALLHDAEEKAAAQAGENIRRLQFFVAGLQLFVGVRRMIDERQKLWVRLHKIGHRNR